MSKLTKEELLNLGYLNKIKLIENDEYLDIFIADSDSHIRESVAERGYRLDILLKDENSNVRDTARYTMKNR